MKANQSKVEYRLLQQRSSLLVCAACFRHGKITPIPQVLSARHRVKNLCPDCQRQHEKSD